MWSSPCCTDHSSGSAIKTHVPAHKMDRCLIMVVTDRVVLVTERESLGNRSSRP